MRPVLPSVTPARAPLGTQTPRARPGTDGSAWAGRIRAALENDRLLLRAQPVVDAWSGIPFEHELLVRLMVADYVLAPAAFLPVAEELGLTAGTDRWVASRAAFQAFHGDRVSVNVSAAALASPAYLRALREAASGRTLERLTFELAAPVVSGHTSLAGAFAQRVRSLGAEVAVDGLSFRDVEHLAAVYRLRPAIVKVNVQGLRPNAIARATERVRAAASATGARVVALGVGAPEKIAACRDAGFDGIQGRAVGAPAPLEQLGGPARTTGSSWTA